MGVPYKDMKYMRQKMFGTEALLRLKLVHNCKSTNIKQKMAHRNTKIVHKK
jgi:hypothetical protein